MKAIALEAVVVGVAGAVLAFAANSVSPRGLTLARNYFPGATNGVVAAPATNSIAGIREKGLQWLNRTNVVQLFKDARFQQALIVFIDARDEAHYNNGHIPGALEFDPYYPGRHLASVLSACQAAEEIVVYCNGGDCEDSQFAAVLLRDAGIPNQKLFVFNGGMTAWVTNGLPVEIGERNSGNIRNPLP